MKHMDVLKTVLLLSLDGYANGLRSKMYAINIGTDIAMNDIILLALVIDGMDVQEQDVNGCLDDMFARQYVMTA